MGITPKKPKRVYDVQRQRQRLPRGIFGCEYGYSIARDGWMEVYRRPFMQHIPAMHPHNRRRLGSDEVMRRVLLVAGLQPVPESLYLALNALTAATLVLCDGWIYSDIHCYAFHDILDDLYKTGRMRLQPAGKP